MEEPIISFENLTFQYHSQSEPTLNNINLTIYSGEKIVIVGASGSGKSTLANCINGLIPNSYKGELSGCCKVRGLDISKTSLFDLSFQVGTVLQDTDGQFIGLTVGEDMAFALENDEVKNKEMHEAVDKWIDMVDMKGFKKHRPQDLSGGQKQRVSMAGVLIDDSPILLFDEPLANLDPKAGLESIELIDKIHKDTNHTIVIIEHRLEEVLHRPVDRIIVMDEGKIVADMSPNELLKETILLEQGIREPLYLSAMRYAEVPFQRFQDLEQFSDTELATTETYVTNWLEKQALSSVLPPLSDLLTVSNVTYGYQSSDKKALNDVSFSIKKGEMISLVGKNGAGKSTLAKAICGFIRGTGQMMWESTDMSSWSIKERADKIGYVMQNPNQMISKKLIREEVELGLLLRGVPSAEIAPRVDEVLKVCGLYSFRNWPISALSFGQKKRVTIASILVLEPELIILDEPTAGQDFKHYTDMMAFLESLNQLGMTILMVTHDMHLMLEYTDRTIVMLDGKIIADDTPANVLTNTALTEKASLKETSLFTFAKCIGLKDPVSFVTQFTAYDRKVRLR